MNRTSMPLEGFCLYRALLGLMQTTTSVVVLIYHMKDLRTLCPRCRSDYQEAGYRLRLIPGRYKEPCDKCGRGGLTFELFEENKKPCKSKSSPMR